MSRDANLGFDSHYNRRLQDIISQLDNMDVLVHQPQMLGGGALRSHILPSGELGHYPPVAMLAEARAMGGKFNLTKFLRPTMKVLNSKPAQAIIKPLTDAVIHEGVRYAVGGKISRSKKAKKWTGYAVDTVNKGLDLGAKAKRLFGGKISRSKKAKKWTGYAVDTVNKGLDLGAKAKRLFGYGEMEDVARKVVRKAKKVAKDPLVQEIVSVARKAPVVKRVVAKAKSIVGGGRAKRAEIVKAVMAKHGMKMIEASKFVKANGLY